MTVLIPIHRDGNREWLQQAVNSLRGTRVLVLENDGEVAEAYNEGVRAAATEFVLPFGSDDVALPGFVEFLLGPAWNADVVYPAMILANSDLTVRYGIHTADHFCPVRLRDLNFVSGASLIRRSKLLEVGGFREVAYEDWDLYVRMLDAGARFKPCPEAQLVYRRHGEGLSRGALSAAEHDALRLRITGGEPRVAATFYAQATPATAYYRCQLPARYLPGKVLSRSPEVAFGPAGEVVFPQHQGAAVMQFASDVLRAGVSLHMREQGVRVLVEADDNYLINPGREVMERQGWGMRIGEGAFTREGHRAIVRRADGVIVTTPYLADRYRKVNPNTYVCPNGVDPADWPEPVKPDDGVLRVAWVASQSHEIDMPLIGRAMRWASEQPGVEVTCVGLNPRESGKMAHRWWFRFGHVRWLHDLDAYRDTFRRFDIGVAPLLTSSQHSMGRSDIKAAEYAMGLACPVVQDAAPYAAWTDGNNCLKARDDRDWLRVIKHLVARPEEARQLAAAAREYVLAERTAAAQVGLWREAIEG